MSAPLLSLKQFVDDLLEAYARQLSTLSSKVFETFGLIDQLRTEQEEAVQRLREALARNRTFRRSDFDALARDHFQRLSAQEAALRAALRRFMQLHTDLVPRLRAAMDRCDQAAIADLHAASHAAEDDLRSAVNAFRASHQRLMERIAEASEQPQSIHLRQLRALLGPSAPQAA